MSDQYNSIASSRMLGDEDANPDSAARAYELSNATGVPPTVIHNDLEGFEQDYKAGLTSQILKNNDYLSDFVNSHPLHGPLIADDVANLDEYSNQLNRFGPHTASIAKKAIEGFGEGFGSELPGSWVTSNPNWMEEYTRHPIGMSILGAAGIPLELIGRAVGGVAGAVKGGATELHRSNFGDETAANKFGADLGEMIQNQMMGMGGVEAFPHVGTPVEVAKAAEKIKPYVDAGREPPIGVHPLIDQMKEEQAKVDAKNLDDALRSAQSTNLRERAPEKLAEFTRLHTEGSVLISADAVRKLYGEARPEIEDGKLGWVPGIAEHLADAETFGGHVEIPLADWLAKVDPEVAKELHDDIKLRPGSLTVNEVEEIKALRQERSKVEEENGPEAFEAYHASPIDFDKFDINKAGEGVGAQPQGRGQYFSDSEELSGVGGTYHELFKETHGKSTSYKVNIKANPEKFIHLDKTYAEQPENVKNLIRKLGLEKDIHERIAEGRDSGYEVLNSLESHFVREEISKRDELPHPSEMNGILAEISKKLSDEDVPGTKWKNFTDEQGKDSHNYVVFNDDAIQITHKNNQAIEAIREAAGLTPLAQVSGEPKVALERYGISNRSWEDVAQFGEHNFNILRNKEPIGTIHISEERGGKRLYVDYVGGQKGAGTLGPSATRDLMREIKKEFPKAESISGARVSGAREGKEVEGAHVEVPLRQTMQEALDHFEDILNGGHWEDIGYDTKLKVQPEALYTAHEKELAQAFKDTLAKITPRLLEPRVAKDVKIGGQSVQGMFINPEDRLPIIAMALDTSEDAVGTARHEAIHHLYRSGFFTPEEWKVLKLEAVKDNWMRKYNIYNRYRGESLNLQFEEGIAEEFANWMRDPEQAHVAGRIFEKIKKFLLDLGAKVREILGQDVTAADIFRRVERGEVGSRRNTEPLHPDAYRHPFAQETTEPPIKSGHVRFYHGADKENDPTSGGPRWVTPNKEYAKRFRSNGEDKEVHYVDIPKDNPTEIKARAWDDIDEAGQTNMVGRYNNIEIPEELAKQLKPLAEQKVEPSASITSSISSISTSSEPIEDRAAFEKGAALGMTERQFKAHMKLIGKQNEEDIAAHQARVQAEIRKTQTKEWKENEARVKGEARSDIMSRPDIAADEFFRTGKYGESKVGIHRLANDALSEEEKKGLPAYYISAKGLDPDDIAGSFGFTTGKAMVDRLALIEQERRASGLRGKEYIDGLVDAETAQRMEKQYGKLDENILREAEDHVISKTQMDILHDEVMGMAAKAKVELPLSRADIEDWAKQSFDGMRAGGVSVESFLASAGRAGRLAETAYLKQDWREAFKAKQQQRISMLMAEQAKKYEKAREQFDKQAKRLGRREVEGLSQEYTNFIHDIMNKVGLNVKRDVADIKKEIAAGSNKSFEDFVREKVEHDHRVIPVADFLLDPNFSKQLDDLTVEQFKALNDTVKALVKNGRDERKIIVNGEEMDKAEAIAGLNDQLATLGEKPYTLNKNFSQRAAESVKRVVWARLLQLESIFNRWDRGDPNGQFNTLFSYPAAEAGASYSQLTKKYSKLMQGLAKFDGNLSQKIENTLFRHPETNVPFLMTRKNLRAVLQNAGNESNLKKLALGYKVMPEQVMQWLQRNATKNDWDWAQAQGEIFAEIKKETDRMEREISGVASEDVKIKPFQVQVDGKPETMKGWYHPIVYSKSLEGESKKLMGPDPLEEKGFVRATTARGHEKQRTGYIAPLELQLDATPGQMSKMLRNIAFRPFLIQASKVFYDKGFRAAVSRHYGEVYRDLLTPYLKDIGGARAPDTRNSGAAERLLEFSRQNIVGTMIGMNIGTVEKHGFSAAMNSVAEVGVANFAREAINLFGTDNPEAKKNWDWAIQKSDELQRRHQHWIDTIGGAHEQVNVQDNAYTKARQKVLEWGTKPVSFFDLASAVPTFLAAYKEAIKQGETEGRAKELGDRAVRRAHGSTAITSKPEAMRGNAMGRSLTSLYGFFNQMLQRQYEIAWRSADMIGEFKQGEYDKGKEHIPKITMLLVSSVLFPALVEEMVTPYTNSEKDSWGKKAAKAVGSELSSSWPVFRDIVHAFINGRDPSIGLFNSDTKAITDFAKDIAKGPAALNKQHAGDTFQHGITAFGMATGLANAEMGRLAKAGIDYSTGAARPRSPKETARLLTTGHVDRPGPLDWITPGRAREKRK